LVCRYCRKHLSHCVADLGNAPPSNAYIDVKNFHAAEKWYPLSISVCDSCWLVQTIETPELPNLFDAEYAYHSGFSKSWLKHCETFVEAITNELRLDQSSKVIEIAANDGHLLQFFNNRNVPCLGIEPTASSASIARCKGIRIIEDFFSNNLARSIIESEGKADLIIANNVLAHVPNIADFVSGFSILLKENGICTFEFPHLPNLIGGLQFDTIYHEHFSYLSLTTVKNIFEKNNLDIFRVDTLKTHGGSLRVFAQRKDKKLRSQDMSVAEILTAEEKLGVGRLDYYAGFQTKIENIKYNLLRFLLDCKKNHKTVVAYGAAAKGNTLLNFAGIRPDLINFVVDANPAKQNKLLPGSRIPVVDQQKLREAKPDFIMVIPWNLKEEILSQLQFTSEWGAKIFSAVPEIEMLA